jgi:hypothetical protein
LADCQRHGRHLMHTDRLSRRVRVKAPFHDERELGSPLRKRRIGNSAM